MCGLIFALEASGESELSAIVLNMFGVAPPKNEKGTVDQIEFRECVFGGVQRARTNLFEGAQRRR